MMQTQSLHVNAFFQKKLKPDPAADRASPSRPQSGRRPRTNRPSRALFGAPTHFQIKRLGPGLLRRKVTKLSARQGSPRLPQRIPYHRDYHPAVVPRLSAVRDDNLPEMTSALEMPIGVASLGEGECQVDRGAQAVNDDGAVHSLEISPAPDAD